MEHLEIKPIPSAAAAAKAGEYLLNNLSKTFFSMTPNCLLLSGGSCIDVALALAQTLPAETSLSNTTLLLADERWVQPGSADSNEHQLRAKGALQLFEERGARFIPILGQADTPQKTSLIVEEQYKQILSASAYTVLLAGIGPDGHTVGMLPEKNSGSFSEKFSGGNLVEYYQLSSEQPNPYRERVTITLSALSKVNDVIIFAVGENKKDALNHLKNKDMGIHQIPALGLYLSLGSVTLLTDVVL